MNDRRVMRSRTRAAARRPAAAVCHSCEEDETDTSASDQTGGSPVPVAPRHGSARCRGGGYCSDSAAHHPAPAQRLPPIGVYWDIENCQIPRGKSAVAVAQAIRDQFFSGYRETEFVVVCDVKRESPQVIQDLENAQVNVIHVGSQSKNAADEKLRQSIRRFADTHGTFGPSFRAAIVLISGDINFAPDLCDLRHRQKIHVILVHNDNCSESLMVCASETCSYSALVAGLPLRGAVKGVQQAEVVVSGLPVHYDPAKVRARLKRLAENCGGRVGPVAGPTATVRFPSLEFGIRAQKRMDKEDVFGNQIAVGYPTVVDGRRQIEYSPSKSSYRKVNWSEFNGNRNEERKIMSLDGARSYWKAMPPVNSGMNGVSDGRFKKPFPVAPFYNQENVPNSVNSKLNDSSWENIQNKQPTRHYGGRPILGRQHGASFSYESKTNEGHSNGRHSLDSMLDFEVERDAQEKEKQSNATFENWLRNSTSNLDTAPAVLGINTSIPPPPIVNLPRRNDKYFFHPIETQNLTNGHATQSSPSPTSSNEAGCGEPARCPAHSLAQSGNGAAVVVTVRLGDFSARLTALVTGHGNRLPLASLKDCYEAQFGALPSDGRGVALEHLVAWVRSLELAQGPSGKYLRLSTNISPSFSEPQAGETTEMLAQFSKDMQSLLTAQPKCQLAFDQISPVYNRMFGRPCRLSDYGCTKLIQLLEKLPHVVQVMGEGPERVVTLAPRVQLQRFTADLSRVLQTTPGRQLAVADLPHKWLSCMGRPLVPTDYGLCYVEDLLDLVPAGAAAVAAGTVALARRLPQTPAQTRRTDQFALQVVELLSTVADFTLEFAKFCPAYHRHFGVQCKLADYGFSKLVDLFEAIPHIVSIEGEMDTGRRVALTLPERLKVVSARVEELVRARHPPGLHADALLCAYLWRHGAALRPDHYGCRTVTELVAKLPGIKVITSAEGTPIIIPAENEPQTTGDTKQNYYSQPKPKETNEKLEVKANPDKTEAVRGVGVMSSPLLNLLKKAQECSTIENGLNGSELYSPLKKPAMEPVVTLLPPEQFLKPISRKSPINGLNGSVFPSSPDPSALPKPVGLALQVNGGFDNCSNFFGDVDWNEQNRRRQRVKLAPQFCPPLQHN